MNAPLFYIIASLMVLPISGTAQVASQSFEIPKHCEGFLTTQYRGCSVTHYYRCDGLDGQIIGLSVNDENSLFLHRHDEEFRTLEQRHADIGVILELEQPEEDPISLSDLTQEGMDTFDFVEVVNGETRLHYKGFDKLTDITVEIDGRSLQMTEFKYVMRGPDDEVLDQQSGQQFVDPDFPLLHPGIYVDELDSAGTSNHTPVDFIFPGEVGFASRVPKYDCDANT